RPNGAEKQPWGVEGGREGDTEQGGRPPRMRFPRWLLWLTLGLLAVNILVASNVDSEPQRIDVPFSYFQEQVREGNVAEVTSQGEVVQGEFTRALKPPAAGA